MMVEIIPFTACCSLLLWLSPRPVAADSAAGSAPQVTPDRPPGPCHAGQPEPRLAPADRRPVVPLRSLPQRHRFPALGQPGIARGLDRRPPAVPRAPRKVLPGGILDHVYFEELVLTQTLSTGGNPAPAAGLTANLFWLACRDLCVPGQATLTVPVTDPEPEAAALRQTALAARPAPFAGRNGPGRTRGRDDHARGRRGLRAGVHPRRGRAPCWWTCCRTGAPPARRLTLRLRSGTRGPGTPHRIVVVNHKDGRRQAGTISIP
jgi:hypothetical protein